MTVLVQRKGRGSVAQAALHGLDVVAGTDGRDGIRMPKRKPLEKLSVFKGFSNCGGDGGS